jgi:hypothetical protein
VPSAQGNCGIGMLPFKHKINKLSHSETLLINLGIVIGRVLPALNVDLIKQLHTKRLK